MNFHTKAVGIALLAPARMVGNLDMRARICVQRAQAYSRHDRNAQAADVSGQLEVREGLTAGVTGLCGGWGGEDVGFAKFYYGFGLSNNSRVTRFITLDQSFGRVWRNIFMVGYQGLSDLFSCHRQSVSTRLSIHTGLPMAPAKCATPVSTVITRSRPATSAAVSVQSRRRFETSWTLFFGSRRSCVAGGPSCNETKLTFGTLKKGAIVDSCTDRRLSNSPPPGGTSRLPAHVSPTFRPDNLLRNPVHGAGSVRT